MVGCMKNYIVLLDCIGCVRNVIEVDEINIELKKKLGDIRYCGDITEIPDTILYDGDTSKNNNLVKCICLGKSSSISRYIYVFMRCDEYDYGQAGLLMHKFTKGNRIDRLKIILKLLKFVFLKKNEL